MPPQMPIAMDDAPSRALIVDDDPMLREIMAARLAAMGFEPVLAENGEEAVKALEAAPYSLAIIDLRMPKLDGFGLLELIRGDPRCADLPVIVATTSDDAASIEKAYALGASSFGIKPINWPLFERHVRFVVRNGATERKLRQAMAQAEMESRLKNGLFLLLSHELKTPLASLVGFAGVLSTALEGRLSDEEVEQLGHLSDAARRLNAIVADILLYSRTLSGKAQLDIAECRPADILDDALSGIKRAARQRRIALDVRHPEDEETVACDAMLVQRALNKLIDNAIKFAPEGGKVEVWSDRDSDGSRLFFVRDNGPGMSEAHLEECLRPFVQGDMSYSRPAEGLGLGLPVARGIADAHGGGLVCRTAPGQGMTAAIRIPPGLKSAA